MTVDNKRVFYNLIRTSLLPFMVTIVQNSNIIRREFATFETFIFSVYFPLTNTFHRVVFKNFHIKIKP